MEPDGTGSGTKPRAARSTLSLALAVGFGILFALAAVGSLRRTSTVVVVIVIATFLAVGLDRPVDAMVRRGLKRAWAVLAVVAAGALLLCAGIAVLVPVLAGQLDDFFASVPGRIQQIMNSWPASRLHANTDLGDALTKAITAHNLERLAVGVLGTVANAAAALFFGLTTALMTLLMLANLDRLINGAVRFVPASHRARVYELVRGIIERVGGYLVGAVAVAAIAGTTAFLFCWIASIPYPFLMAVIVAVMDMIPQVGATIGSTVVILVAATESIGTGIAALVFFCCYQGLENWLIYPRVMSRAVRTTNLGAIISTLVGGALFGVLGVLLAVPVLASVQLIIREVIFPKQERE